MLRSVRANSVGDGEVRALKIAVILPSRKHDYLVETIIHGLLDHADDHGIHHDVRWFAEHDHNISIAERYQLVRGQETSEDKLVEFAREADCVLTFFVKKFRFDECLIRVLKRINRPEVTAYIDGSEWTSSSFPNENQVQLARRDPVFRRGHPWINENFMNKGLCGYYFKRECYEDDAKQGIISLPFANVKPSRVRVSPKKTHDVFCCFGQTNDGLRADVVSFLRSWQTQFDVRCPAYGFERQSFRREIAESRIAIDAWGGGDCCARFYEIVGNGTLIAFQKYQIEVPYPYTDGKNCIEYSNISELKVKLENTLSDHSKLDAMTRACIEHTEQYHTASARALYMLQKMGIA